MSDVVEERVGRSIEGLAAALIGTLVVAIVAATMVQQRSFQDVSELGAPIVPLDQVAAIFVDVAVLTLLLGAIVIAAAARSGEVSES